MTWVLFLRSPTLPAIDARLLLAGLGLRASRASAVPFAASIRKQASLFARRPGASFRPASQPGKISRQRRESRRRIAISSLCPQTGNCIEQCLVRFEPVPLVRRAHGLWCSWGEFSKRGRLAVTATLPASVLGPVLAPPCSLQRPFCFDISRRLHGVPALVLAPQQRPRRLSGRGRE